METTKRDAILAFLANSQGAVVARGADGMPVGDNRPSNVVIRLLGER